MCSTTSYTLRLIAAILIVRRGDAISTLRMTCAQNSSSCCTLPTQSGACAPATRYPNCGFHIAGCCYRARKSLCLWLLHGGAACSFTQLLMTQAFVAHLGQQRTFLADVDTLKARSSRTGVCVRYHESYRTNNLEAAASFFRPRLRLLPHISKRVKPNPLTAKVDNLGFAYIF